MTAPSPQESRTFYQRILRWFRHHGRHDLPWQHDVTPYRVWVSEVMLQQTQVTTVIPYFERFMTRFPTVYDLAKAPQDELMGYWSGLGYYARARNLHQCAKFIAEHGGTFPDTLEGLMDLPGIGESTAGAILSLAMGQSQAILDGNVKRVLCRYFAIEGWPGKTAVHRELWAIAKSLTPPKNTDQYNQAMMDMGATICTRSKPNCDVCPVSSGCAAFRQGRQTHFPVRKPKKTLPVRQTKMLLLHTHDGKILLEARPQTGIWGGLWSLPECATKTDVTGWCVTQLGTAPLKHWDLAPMRHTFSHFHLDITPTCITIGKRPKRVHERTQYDWVSIDQRWDKGIPAPVTSLVNQLRQHLSEGHSLS